MYIIKKLRVNRRLERTEEEETEQRKETAVNDIVLKKKGKKDFSSG